MQVIFLAQAIDQYERINNVVPEKEILLALHHMAVPQKVMKCKGSSQAVFRQGDGGTRHTGKSGDGQEQCQQSGD